MQHNPIIRVRLCAVLSMALLLGAALALVSCIGGNEARAYYVNPGGDETRGKNVIGLKGCGSCHEIPGINGAQGLVGPPLIHWSRRTYVAGEVANQPQNLVKWLMSPQSIEPQTAMPNVGLTEQEARDAAAYLYTLQ